MQDVCYKVARYDEGVQNMTGGCMDISVCLEEFEKNKKQCDGGTSPLCHLCCVGPHCPGLKLYAGAE